MVKKQSTRRRKQYPKGPREHVYELEMEKKLKKIITEKQDTQAEQP